MPKLLKTLKCEKGRIKKWSQITRTTKCRRLHNNKSDNQWLTPQRPTNKLNFLLLFLERKTARSTTYFSPQKEKTLDPQHAVYMEIVVRFYISVSFQTALRLSNKPNTNPCLKPYTTMVFSDACLIFRQTF